MIRSRSAVDRRLSAVPQKSHFLDYETTVVVYPMNELPAEVNLDNNLPMESRSRWSEIEGLCGKNASPGSSICPRALGISRGCIGGGQCICCGAVTTIA